MKLIVEQFRESSSSTCVSVPTLGFEIALIMTLAGLRSGPAAQKYAGFNVIPMVALVLTAMILTVSLIFRMINRFVATSDKIHDLGVLILLGASFRQVVELRILETLFVAIPGAMIGILLTFVAQFVVLTMAFPFLTFEVRWEWFVIAGAIASGCDLTGAYLATWIAFRKELIDILY
jgi:ABC-type antimicrobial peptide transport system permease subunit